ELPPLGNAQLANGSAEVANLAVGQTALAADRLRKRALSVPVHARDAQHLTEMQLQRNVLDPWLRPVAGGVGHVQLERDLTRISFRLGLTPEPDLELWDLGCGHLPALREHEPDDLRLELLGRAQPDSFAFDAAGCPTLEQQLH